LKVFGNRMLGEYLNPSGVKWREAGEDCIIRRFITCILTNIIWVIMSNRM